MSDEQNKGPKGVVLFAFGGADSLENVEAFIGNVLEGRREVTPEMVEDAKSRYSQIGGHSPLLEITSEQATGISDILNEGRPGSYKVYVAMRNWHPFIKDTIDIMVEDGITEAVGFIMAPHSSKGATGMYQFIMEEALEAIPGEPLSIDIIEGWHTAPQLVEAIADNLREAIRGYEESPNLTVVFSAHSLPLVALGGGDSYVGKLKETIEKVVEIVPVDYRLAYQSKGGGSIEWLGPGVEELLPELEREGKKEVCIVPLGFAADHVETLYDIDIHFRSIAGELGLTFLRSASLNSSEKFLQLLSGLVREHFGDKR